MCFTLTYTWWMDKTRIYTMHPLYHYDFILYKGLKYTQNFKGHVSHLSLKIKGPHILSEPYIYIYISFCLWHGQIEILAKKAQYWNESIFSRAIWALGLLNPILWAFTKFLGHLAWGPTLFWPLSLHPQIP